MTTPPDRPPLLAFLICLDILHQEGVSTLYRVVDTFNAEVGVQGLPDDAAGKIALSVRHVVYVRWGEGGGDFEQRLVLVRPDGKEAEGPHLLQKFSKPEGFHFAQFRIEVNLMVAVEGIYRWRLYLNDEQVAEHPFRVNIAINAQPEPPLQ